MTDRDSSTANQDSERGSEAGIDPALSRELGSDDGDGSLATDDRPASKRRRVPRWLLWTAGAAVLVGGGLVGVAIMVGRHFEPYIREQAIHYLETRFESKVELAGLHVRAPWNSAYRLLRPGGPELVLVEGEGLQIRHHGRTDIPPMLVMKNFTAAVDLRTLFSGLKTVADVTLDGVEINVPPKGERPTSKPSEPGSKSSVAAAKASASAKKNKSAPVKDDKDSASDAEDAASRNTGVLIEHVVIRNAVLSLLPKNPSKQPLRFDLHEVRLDSAGLGTAMNYAAKLTNAKPVGEITSNGTFGPWAAGEPSETPLAGKYLFENADLSIFRAIAGTLRSTGSFEGQLGLIQARGEASVPNFSLKRAGNPVPLTTTFEVLVDGTNGNTELKPVQATLGSTKFTTSGAVIRYQGDTRKTITLDVSMPKGNMRDVLRLAMKGDAFMEGTIALKTKIGIPPLSGTVKEKLLLSGTFDVTNGKFLRSTIQDQIDSLSRRGQGQPNNREIDEVVSHLSGQFDQTDETLHFNQIVFALPGAAVNLAGGYDMGEDMLDFHGAVSLDAKVSQTMTGWKRWLLKPADPFFSKNGAGTYLKIQITGPAKKPKFGLDHGGSEATGSKQDGKSAITKLEKSKEDPTKNSLRRNEKDH